MTRPKKYKNAILPGTALPPREDLARQMKLTTDLKVATVQSILFKFSALASAAWHEGYSVESITDEQYTIQTVRNSSPFVMDLYCYKSVEDGTKAIPTLAQSFQFSSSAHNFSVSTCPKCRTLIPYLHLGIR